MKFIASSTLFLFFFFLQAANAQFACTFSSTDEPSCLSHKDDDGTNCVWCSLSQFGFCVDEGQAESMEKSVPGVQCERNGPNGNDDAAPATDDGVAPSDDTIPDNYWKCLLQKTADACTAAECTWCKTKAGFGVCMTGPSAEAAKESDWFDCKSEDFDEDQDMGFLADPYDPMCALSFLQNPTKDGCTAATDSDGNACEFCDLQGMGNLCLNAEQAEMAQQIGVTCDASTVAFADAGDVVENPFDPACGLAFLQNPTKQGCKASSDSDGKVCAFCNMEGNPLCLTTEQAKIVGSIGVTCDSSDVTVEEDSLTDPYDPTCALSFLQNPTKDGCTSATDSDGNACEFCDLQGMGNLCLNAEQAEMAQQIGVTCDSQQKEKNVQDPYDPMCALSFLQNPTKDGCTAATDSDGNACEFCDLQGMGNLCLNAEQAEMAQQIGVTCDASTVAFGDAGDVVENPFDPACGLAFLQNPTKQGCKASSDSDGKVCAFCNMEGNPLCLTTEQAKIVGSIGVTCDSSDVTVEEDSLTDPYDPTCALSFLQNPTKDGCTSATDSDGNACEFCDLQGMGNLCLNAEQAEMAQQIGVTCDASTATSSLRGAVA